MVWCPQSCRRRLNMTNGDLGFPRNLGSCRFLSELPAGDTGIRTPGLGSALVCWGAKRTSERGGTANRKQRSAAGRAAGNRSALIVPMKQGNSPRRTLWREAKRRPAGSTEGHMLNTSRFLCMSTALGQTATGTRRGWRIRRLKNRILDYEHIHVCESLRSATTRSHPVRIALSQSESMRPLSPISLATLR
jgi:hypothetical protein